jgi:DNA repair exonuclease SbcCD ATPase subunit
MRFELIDKVIEQRERGLKETQELHDRIEMAKEELENLKREYEQTVLMSVREQKDLTKELDALAERIEQAEKAVKRREEERAAYRLVAGQGRITADDIVREWNESYLPKVKEQRLTPVLRRLLRAKREVAEATLSYRQLVKEIESEKNDVRNIVGDSVYYKLKGVAFDFKTESDKYLIKDSDLYDLERGEMPRSLQYVDPKEYE